MIGQAYVEDFAFKIFNNADAALKARKATRRTAETFRHAALFLQLLKFFGELEPETAKKVTFAKFQANRILKAINAGEDPNPPLETPKDEGIPDADAAEALRSMGISPPPLTGADEPSRQLLNTAHSAQQSPSSSTRQPYVEAAPDDGEPGSVPPPIPPQLEPSHSPFRMHTPEPSAPSIPDVPKSPPLPPKITSRPSTSASYQTPSFQQPPSGGPLLQDHSNQGFPQVPSQETHNPFFPPSASPSAPPPLPQFPHSTNSPQLPPTAPQQYTHFPPPPQSPYGAPPTQHPIQTPPPQAQSPQSFYQPQPPVHPQYPQSQPPAYTQHPPQGDQLISTEDTEAILKAQKHAKWAISALNFEDIPTAVKELREALKTLGAR